MLDGNLSLIRCYHVEPLPFDSKMQRSWLKISREDINSTRALCITRSKTLMFSIKQRYRSWLTSRSRWPIILKTNIAFFVPMSCICIRFNRQRFMGVHILHHTRCVMTLRETLNVWLMSTIVRYFMHSICRGFFGIAINIERTLFPTKSTHFYETMVMVYVYPVCYGVSNKPLYKVWCLYYNLQQNYCSLFRGLLPNGLRQKIAERADIFQLRSIFYIDQRVEPPLFANFGVCMTVYNKTTVMAYAEVLHQLLHSKNSIRGHFSGVVHVLSFSACQTTPSASLMHVLQFSLTI